MGILAATNYVQPTPDGTDGSANGRYFVIGQDFDHTVVSQVKYCLV